MSGSTRLVTVSESNNIEAVLQDVVERQQRFAEEVFKILANTTPLLKGIRDIVNKYVYYYGDVSISPIHKEENRKIAEQRDCILFCGAMCIVNDNYTKNVKIMLLKAFNCIIKLSCSKGQLRNLLLEIVFQTIYQRKICFFCNKPNAIWMTTDKMHNLQVSQRVYPFMCKECNHICFIYNIQCDESYFIIKFKNNGELLEKYNVYNNKYHSIECHSHIFKKSVKNFIIKNTKEEYKNIVQKIFNQAKRVNYYEVMLMFDK